MRLYDLRARSIYRTSRADKGREGFWLVSAPSADEARTTWEMHNRVALRGEWLFESIDLDARPIIRMH